MSSFITAVFSIDERQKRQPDHFCFMHVRAKIPSIFIIKFFEIHFNCVFYYCFLK